MGRVTPSTHGETRGIFEGFVVRNSREVGRRTFFTFPGSYIKEQSLVKTELRPFVASPVSIYLFVVFVAMISRGFELTRC